MKQTLVAPKLYFLHEGKTNLKNIPFYAGKHVGAVYAEIQRAGLEPVGPIEFIYFGATKDENKEFILQIAIPVKEEKEINGNFQFRWASQLKCVTLSHKGDMQSLHGAYDLLYGHIWKDGLEPNDEIREIYHQFKSHEAPDNVTEIQIGLN